MNKEQKADFNSAFLEYLSQIVLSKYEEKLEEQKKQGDSNDKQKME